MQINLLKKVVENTAGPTAVQIVDLLYGKKNINEFLIAKKLNLTINQTRNLLYRLSHLGILNSIRKKDKRKGWYIYFWTFNILKSLEVLKQTIVTEINAHKIELNNKRLMRFYKCKICGREANEESAMLSNFMCNECGEVYDLADNSFVINDVSKSIEKLQKELDIINGEIDLEEDKQGKKLSRTLKADEKKKKEVRQAKREEKAKEKAKSNPKKVKSLDTKKSSKKKN